jgi:hypothetical protein
MRTKFFILGAVVTIAVEAAIYVVLPKYQDTFPCPSYPQSIKGQEL